MKKNKVILLVGLDRCGKDTVACYLVNTLVNHKFFTFKNSMAEPLRHIINIVNKGTGLTALDLKEKDESLYRKIMTGLSSYLKTVDRDFFPKFMELEFSSYKPDAIIIPDVRFLNEYNYLNNKYSIFTIGINNEYSKCGSNNTVYDVKTILSSKKIDFTLTIPENGLDSIIGSNDYIHLVDKLVKFLEEK